MRAALLLPVILLAGCVSPAEIAQQPPSSTMETSEKITTVRDCMMAGNAGIFTATPYQDGWKVLQIGGDNANFEITLLPRTPSGTHVEVRLAKTLAHADFYSIVKPCLDKLPPA
jgi:hypothetical protein